MIKFFRKIRQNLLSENKLSKYFLYAAGEILLVMIGILLALQVNSWNEERKHRKKEVQLYENLLESLAADSADLIRVRGLFDQGTNALRFVISKSSQELLYENSLHALKDSIEMTTNIGFSFFPRYSAYNQITNNGYLDLIRSEEIKSKLAELYDRTYVRYQHVDASMDEKSEFHLEPIMRGDLQIMEPESGLPYKKDLDQELFLTHYPRFKRECLSILATSVYAERSLIECYEGNLELLILIRKKLESSNP